MKKEDLKKILKPIVKECIREVFFEPGILSTVIQEVMRGTTSATPIIAESRAPIAKQNTSEKKEKIRKSQNAKLQELRENQKRMLDAIGGKVGGVNVFEGTAPLTAQQATASPEKSASDPLSGVDPSDPGIDISKFGF